MAVRRRERARASSVLIGTGIGAAALALLACAHACHCGASHERDAGADAGADGGRDGGVDAGVDGGRVRDAGYDAATDGGPFVPFPEGWEPIPWMPDWCDAWRPRGEARDAVAPLRFVPCEPPSAGCEALVVDWERSPFHHNYFIARLGDQTPPDARHIALSRTVVRGFEDELTDATVFDVEGEPVAVFRTRYFYPRDGMPRVVCSLRSAGATPSRAALAFKVSTGRYHDTNDDADFSVLILADEIGRLQRSSSVIHDLEVRDLFSEGNVPVELHYDGSSVIVAGALGAVYLGSLGGGPWGAIATAGTGDYQSSKGFLFDGTFYWSSVSSSGGWARVRRRPATASVNETFMERPDGALRNFRTDGTWAVWAHDVDLPPADSLPDRTDIYAARIEGSLVPADWSPSVVASLRYPAPVSRPILWNGLFAYLVDDRDLEIVDLERRRIWRVRTETGTWWETLLHMDEQYLFVVHKDSIGIDGMRRYRLAELEGWEAL